MRSIIIVSVLLITGIRYNYSTELVKAFPNLTFAAPVFLTSPQDGTNRIFVVQQEGDIVVFPNDSNVSGKKVFLNIKNKVAFGGERGLLGLVFHPSYSSNGFFYIYYTQEGTGDLIIARYKVSFSDPDIADANSEMVLLNIPHSQYSNHNGGMLMFGLDGYLYMGTGDGGGGGDPLGNGQNKNTLLGKILRIDVNNISGGNNYAIPPDNPFANGGGRPEVYTLGMRNPWRFSQDSVTGMIYCADVGQNKWEEIDIIENGKNYGWNIMEGRHCYSPPTGCDTSGLTLPIKEYDHTDNGCSVTGGYVYRGSRRPDLRGSYIYGDYCSGNIWMLKYENGIVTKDSLLYKFTSFITSFGVDNYNELYVLSSNNNIYRFGSSGMGVIPVPLEFELEQNFPNPFNPGTKIKYGIIKSGNIKLNIYSVSGELVRTLVNEFQRPDNYVVTWDGTGNRGEKMPSGIYFYALQTEDQLLAKKMVIMK